METSDNEILETLEENNEQLDSLAINEEQRLEDYHILLGSKHSAFFENTQYALRKGEFRFTTSISGKEILKLAKKIIPHVIILDVELEEMDGIEVCWELKSDPSLKVLPVLFIADKNEDYTQIAAYEAGADDYIIRPERSRILLAKVNAWLKRCYELSNTSTQIKKFGNIEIDEEQVMLYKKGQSLKVSKKEFQLLLLLTSKPGKVFRRNNILAKIWGDDIIVGDRNIDTHIKKLRKKLGKDHIQTVRGIGYKFQY